MIEITKWFIKNYLIKIRWIVSIYSNMVRNIDISRRKGWDKSRNKLRKLDKRGDKRRVMVFKGRGSN